MDQTSKNTGSKRPTPSALWFKNIPGEAARPGAAPLPPCQRTQAHMAVHVLIQKIPKRPGPTSIAGLRAKRAQPHEIASFNLDPIGIQPVSRLAFQNIKTVFHNMSFQKRNHPTRLESHDCYVHIMTQV